MSRSRGSSRSSCRMAGRKSPAWMSAHPRMAFLRRLAKRGLRGLKLVSLGRPRGHQGGRQGAERHVTALPSGDCRKEFARTDSVFLVSRGRRGATCWEGTEPARAVRHGLALPADPDDHVVVRLDRVLYSSWLHHEVSLLFVRRWPGDYPEAAVGLILAALSLGIVDDRRLKSMSPSDGSSAKDRMTLFPTTPA